MNYVGEPQDVYSNDYLFHSILLSCVFPFCCVVEYFFRGVGSRLGKDRATWCDLSGQGDCKCSSQMTLSISTLSVGLHLLEHRRLVR